MALHAKARLIAAEVPPPPGDASPFSYAPLLIELGDILFAGAGLFLSCYILWSWLRRRNSQAIRALPALALLVGTGGVLHLYNALQASARPLATLVLGVLYAVSAWAAYRSLRTPSTTPASPQFEDGAAYESLKQDYSTQNTQINELRQQVAVYSEQAERNSADTRELEAARAAAEEASRTKTEFLTNMSHEIRTPLNGILGMIGLLLETPLNAKQQQYLAVAQSSGEVLLDLINDVLDISRLEAGRIQLENAEFDLEDLLERSLELVAPRAAEKGIEIGLDLFPRLRGRFVGDQSRLRQIVLNLLSNAIKFTESGTVFMEVMPSPMSTTAGAMGIRFAITDTGIGIDSGDAAHLFQKFSQADMTITRRFGGSGLGLAICKQLVSLMQGEIGVESTKGEGSCFWFEIPLSPARSQLRDRQHLSDRLREMRVLVVDHLAMHRRILRNQLSSLGLGVGEAADGKGALSELQDALRRGQPYHVLLVDQFMADQSGEALGAKITQTPELAYLKLILVASLGEAKQRDGKITGFDSIIAKPVRHDALIYAIGRLFDQTGIPANSAQPEPPAYTPPAVLIVEDNKINQVVARTIVEDAGGLVTIAENGKEALEIGAQTRFDIILMDLQMPIMDGLEATRQFRKNKGPNALTPIVALTAHAMTGDRERALATGMDDYLSKPVDFEALVTTLRKWVDLPPTPAKQQQEPVFREKSWASFDSRELRERSKRQDRADAVASPTTASLAEPQKEKAWPISLVDESRLSMLAQHMPAQKLEQLIAAFQTNLTERVAALGIMLESTPADQILRETHALIGAAGSVGAESIVVQTRALETMCKNDDRSGMLTAYQRLCSLADDTKRAYETWLQTHETAQGSASWVSA